MSRLFLGLFCLLPVLPLSAQDTQALAGQLQTTYDGWRQAMAKSDARAWQALTASSRQMEVRNRIVSEKRPFPAAVFQTPTLPPPLSGLKLVYLSQRGNTAKASWFGKVNFGVDGSPTENLLVLSFLNEAGRWLYDRADFVNLAALPDVRRELAAGNNKYCRETPECQADGKVPPTAIAVPPAQYIAKVYVFCPGREIKVQINQFSSHRFANAKEAEVVIGGAKLGQNTISYRTQQLEGSTGKEAFTIRVYLMSEIPGTKPIIAYEVTAQEGQPVKNYENAKFSLDLDTAAKLVR